MVQAIAVSQPPPSAKPLTAAITGLPRFSMRSSTVLPEAAGRLGVDRRGVRELADVGAGDERLVAGARQDDAAHGGVVARVLEGRLAGPPTSGVFSALSTFGRLSVT